MDRRDVDCDALAAPPLAPGDVVADKYRIEAVVGRGGMSVVYCATHTELDQQVAIKVLSSAALLLPEYVARLKREARASSRIRSEHVVRVFDIGELPARHGGAAVPYLVMEHLVGADLGAVLSRRGALPVGLAVECIMQACEALAEAHALGIIHRDLKPANLFLTESVDGSPCIKVLDFGVSRMIRRTALSTLTDPGTVLGTPSYMAPEQMEGSESLDARSDIWALGAILYELLTARPAYSGESLPQIFMKIMRAKHPPRARSARLDVPPELDAVIAKCLAIEPERRYRTVADLAWALAELGTPHARDSAHRISRVLDKRSAEAGASLASPLLDPASTTRSLIRAPRRRRAVVVATSALVLSAAGAFGVLAAQRAIASEPGAAAAHHAAPTASVGEDAAVVIAPRERPTAGTRGEGTLRIVGSSAIPPQSARPLDERAPRAKDAIVDPDPGGRD